MGKKDYELIAQGIAEARKETNTVLGSGYCINLVMENLIRDFHKENPNFNRSRFRRACNASLTWERAMEIAERNVA